MPISSVSAFEETFNFDYDNNGNLIQDNNLTYNYNSLNQLISIENLENDILSEFFYDESGIRIKKVTENSTTYYFGDFVRIINLSGVFDSIYINDNEGLVAEISDEVLFYHPNHLGSIDIITDTSGDLVSDFEYLPFGKAINGSDSRYTFTGQEYDSESDLMYYNARYYSTFSRKFTQPDTIIPNVYNPQSLNRYSYVQNNPVNRVDPSGHIVFLAALLIGTIVGAIIGGGISAASQYIMTGNVDMGQVGKDALVGAIAGLVATTTFGLGTAVAGTGYAGYTLGGAIAGFTSGRVATVTDNKIDGRAWNDNFVNGKDIARDIVLGAVAGAGGKFIGNALSKPKISMADPQSLKRIHGIKSLSTMQDYKSSMLKNGYGDLPPIKIVTIQNKMIIADGHHRAQAAISAGLKKVPVMEALPSEYGIVENIFYGKSTLNQKGMWISAKDFSKRTGGIW